MEMMKTCSDLNSLCCDCTHAIKECWGAHRHPGEVEDQVDGIQDQGAGLLSEAALCPHHKGGQTKEHIQERPANTQLSQS